MSNPLFYIKTDDTEPAIECSLLDGNGNFADLNGATVMFHMGVAGDTPIVSRAATIVDVPSAHVRIEWGPGETATAGRFLAEWEVQYLAGGIETFPNDRFIEVIISDALQ